MPPPPLVLLPVSMVARKSFAEKLPSFLRTYKTEKFIRVDVPRVGIFFRVGQLLAFMMVLAQLYLNDGWAKGDAPGGISNVWTEPSGMLQLRSRHLTSPSSPDTATTPTTHTRRRSTHSLRLSVRLSCRPS